MTRVRTTRRAPGQPVLGSALTRRIRSVRRQLMKFVEQIECVAWAQFVWIDCAQPVKRGVRLRFDRFILFEGVRYLNNRRCEQIELWRRLSD